MYCPVCKVEHRQGFTRCTECDVDLVDILPPERVPGYENLVAVFEGDSDSAAVARAAVEGAGIESWIQDEEVHGLFPSLGLSKVLVREEDEKSSLKALDTPKQEKHRPDGSGHSTTRNPPGTPGANKRYAPGNRVEEDGITRRTKNETSAKGHLDKSIRRQGKRV